MFGKLQLLRLIFFHRIFITRILNIGMTCTQGLPTHFLYRNTSWNQALMQKRYMLLDIIKRLASLLSQLNQRLNQKKNLYEMLTKSSSSYQVKLARQTLKTSKAFY